MVGKGIREIGIDRVSGKIVVRIESQFFRLVDVDVLVGLYSKAKEKLRWSTKTIFKELVGKIVNCDLIFAEKVNGY